jgi:ABC-type multidrug transport system permease subunit
MPSLHAVWAYLVVFATQGLRRFIRMAAAMFAALTLVAAIEIGGHWFVDLVVALPFAVAVQALVTFSIPFRAPERLAALLGGSALVAGLVGLMFLQPLRFPFSDAFHWLAMIAASAAAIALWQQLARRTEGSPAYAASALEASLRPTNETA